jgi:FkbM family methyltransferase
MNLKMTVLRCAEHTAAMLRKVGLGGVVQRGARFVAPALGRQTLEFDGFRIHCEHAGHIAYMRDLLEHGHDVYFRSLFTNAIPSGGNVVDVGAHLGVMALVAARAGGSACTVYAFEPNPETLPLLHQNLQDNGMGGRVTVIEAGLSDRDSSETFFLTGGGNTSSLHDPGTGARPVTIRTVAADTCLPSNLIVNAVKIDVEGNEVPAIVGMRKTIQRSLHTLTMFVECNPAALRTAGSSPEELFETLHACGLTIRWIDDDTDSLKPLSDEMWKHDYVNLVCTKT